MKLAIACIKIASFNFCSATRSCSFLYWVQVWSIKVFLTLLEASVVVVGQVVVVVVIAAVVVNIIVMALLVVADPNVVVVN